MLFVFIVLFWAAFEQAGGLMNLYAAEKTDRMVGAFEVPAGWFQSLNPLFIVLLAPLFSVAWSRLGEMGRNPADAEEDGAGPGADRHRLPGDGRRGARVAAAATARPACGGS